MPRASALFVVAVAAATACGHAAAPAPPPSGAHVIADAYRDAAGKILDAALHDDDAAYRKLAFLTDHIGNRISGSAALDTAIAWAQATLKADGHDVRTELVMVPHWVRGDESASITAPITRPIVLLGLGGSAATPPGGLDAELVVVTSFDELDALGARVKGKIVLFNHPMPPFGPGGAKYDETVIYRNSGPARVSQLGGAAALVRTVTARSLRSPHTGNTRFEDGIAPIPAAAITVEDAELLARLAHGGETITMHLVMGAQTLPPAPSANVIGELRGREHPEEIVLIGGHIDSWDVGQGAHDDGAGCVIVMQALTTLRKLGLTPRRTIRVVLFTNEENGAAGGHGYFDAHQGELAQHVAAIESDNGGFAPEGFDVMALGRGRETILAQIADIAGLLAPIGATSVTPARSGGTDIHEATQGQVTQLGLAVDESTYFDYHHSQADTLDKVDPKLLAKDVAAVAIMAYVLADMPVALGRAESP